MNHFVGLVVLSVIVSMAFTLLNPKDDGRPVRHFLLLLVYMVLGSFGFAWLMYFLPF